MLKIGEISEVEFFSDDSMDIDEVSLNPNLRYLKTKCFRQLRVNLKKSQEYKYIAKNHRLKQLFLNLITQVYLITESEESSEQVNIMLT
jgi:hypothetical protein